MGNVKILIKKKVQKTSKTGKQFWSIIGGDGTYYNAWPSSWSDALAEGDQIMVSVTSKEVNGMTFHSINKPNTDEILMEMMSQLLREFDSLKKDLLDQVSPMAKAVNATKQHFPGAKVVQSTQPETVLDDDIPF
jgi:wyosine [tRNA(Phe)-imidazoG37] synthetase (radical SAM superfamily)